MTLRVLSVASECVPLVKTGGLADVVGALPSALAGEDVQMRILLPGYRGVLAALGTNPAPLMTWDSLFGGKARLVAGQAGGLDILALDAPHLYDRDGTIYLDADGHDWPDNPERFAALSLAAARLAAEGAADWHPQVVHLHDWQAGLTPLYMRQLGASDRVGSLMTIHNIAFQGLAPSVLIHRLGLPVDEFHPGGFEFYGQISALKAGIVYADKISTVSPTYANELMTPEFGMGLNGVLRSRRADLVGILNGIDEALWAPPYKTPRGKPKFRAALRAQFGLAETNGPLCVVVSRLTEQKGLDLLLEALPTLLDAGGQLAVLGTGRPAIEAAFRAAANAHAGVAVRIGYDEELAQQMITGGDAIIVPSRFEPCGLTQLFGLRYGTVPVVALTGGLADTIIPANAAGRAAGVATGFQFHPISAQALSDCLHQVIRSFAKQDEWARIQRNAMAHPVGWSASANAYGTVLRSLVKPSQ